MVLLRNARLAVVILLSILMVIGCWARMVMPPNLSQRMAVF